jgi:hypothetical protein
VKWKGGLEERKGKGEGKKVERLERENEREGKWMGI